MKFTVAAATLAAFSMSAAADEFTFGGSATVGTERVFRGLSVTDETPGAAVSLEVGYGTWYLGGQYANMDEALTGAPTELSWSAGARPVLGPASIDVGVTYYGYFGEAGGADLDWYEAHAGAAAELFDGLIAGVTGYYSPDFYGESGPYWRGEVNATYVLPVEAPVPVYVFGAAAYSEVEDLGISYYDYHLGAGAELTEGVDVTVTFYDTDGLPSGFDSIADGRFVAAATFEF